MNEQKTENFRAFAKLYGYIRFFHPSDEAAAMDWDKFAVYGMKYVESANNNEELKLKLEDLFKPIAPSVDIFSGSGEYKYDLSRIIPKDTVGLLPVAWQHRGLGVSNNYLYKSIRYNRINLTKNSFGTISKYIDAVKYREKKIRLKAIILADVEGKNNGGHLWLRVDRKNKEMGFFDNMGNRPIKTDRWKEYEITGDVAPDAEYIVFGCFLAGEGVVLIDKIELEFLNGKSWEEIEFDNTDFEKDTPGSAPTGWNFTQEDYDFEVISYNSETGKQSCKIESVYSKLLFEKFPQPGEYFVKQISNSLGCAVPLSIYSDNTGTLPHADTDKLREINKSIGDFSSAGNDADLVYIRLADVAVTWNVIRHSYPYFDLYDFVWENVLDEYLARIYNCKGENEYTRILEEMVAIINDGHGRVYNSKERTVYYYPPFLGDFAEGELVVSRLLEENTGINEGDIILEIDGKSISEMILEAGGRISASTPQWRNDILLRVLLRKKENTDLTLKLRRNGNVIERMTKLNFTSDKFISTGYYKEYRPEKIKEIEKGVYYVDLERSTMKEIYEVMEKLAEAKGVIFDLRGYPNSTHEVLNHLTDVPISSAKWNVPQIIYPDMENLVGFDTTGRWKMEPLQPKIKGKVIFLTFGGAISYAESVIGIVEAYKLGTIVGETTAGTNGNVNTINLPGGYAVSYTGMKVLKHDGSRHHGIGIKPDVEVHRTIKGIKEKRDEFLEKAIDIINSN